MTIDEFNNTRWTASMCCIYMGERRDIASVDFNEQLIGMVNITDLDGELIWARCENIELIDAT